MPALRRLAAAAGENACEMPNRISGPAGLLHVESLHAPSRLITLRPSSRSAPAMQVGSATRLDSHLAAGGRLPAILNFILNGAAVAVRC